MYNRKQPILIVEDDANTASLVQTYLENEGFTTAIANDGEEALRKARQLDYGFVILDIMLPKIDGWEVCRQLRTFSNMPILMLTAREEEIDRVTGLSLGADDYLVKPFSPRELVARVKAILRRVHLLDEKKSTVIRYGSLELDLEKHRLQKEQRTVSLTASEYRLIEKLMGSPGRVFSRSELLDILHDDGETVIDRVVDVHIGKLRQKIETSPSQPEFIHTVRGFGYAFTDREQ